MPRMRRSSCAVAPTVRWTRPGPRSSPRWHRCIAARPPDELARLLRGDARPLLLDLPGIARLAATVPAPVSSALADPERRQPRALEALLRWLGRVAEMRPIVLVIEDLHLADAATRAFATFVARIARHERITLVLSFEPDRLTREHPLRENLAVIDAGLRPPVRIDLGPLTRREMAGLIEGIEGERPSASIVVLVAERSAGSPLVVEELLAIRRELRSATLAGSLSDLVAARMARRAPECRRVLRLLATAERPMERARLVAASEAFEADAVGHLPPRSATRPRHAVDGLDPDLAAGLGEAIEHGFVRLGADGLLRIRHELVGRAVIADLLPSLVPRYHVALARAFADVPIVAATHWGAAHRLTEAREAAIAAGRLALRMEAPHDALAALELGLELPAPPVVADEDAPAELAQLAAEAAYGSMRPLRAVAYAESARAMLGERSDRLARATLEARLGRYRLAAGDAAGATSAFRRAAESAPPEPSVERARILALLAQERMIAGAFGDAERAATRALDLARSLGEAAEPEAIHATTTLAVVLGWGDRPERAEPLLREALARAEALGLAEERWRATANLTPVLEIQGRLREAVDAAYEGMAWARANDLDAVYGNLLAGNVAGAFVEVGRWSDARELCLRALDWSPAGVTFVNAILDLVIVEIESEAGEEASRLLGRILVELETGGDLQFAIPAYQATASLAMWSGDLADARRASERGWARVRGSEDWAYVARMASTVLEVEAAVVAEALERRRIGDVAASRERASRVLAEAEASVARARDNEGGLGSSEPEARLATARAFHARLMGRDDPAIWDDVAARWQAVGDPYREARARWRQSETILGAAIAGPGGARDRTDARVVRADAREPLLAAAHLALGLRARPLLRRLVDLAGRALIQLPPEVDELLAQPVAPASPGDGGCRRARGRARGPARPGCRPVTRGIVRRT